jgi:hypothetical protein
MGIPNLMGIAYMLFGTHVVVNVAQKYAVWYMGRYKCYIYVV